MFQLKFTLKQHTPIIHFQHNHAGATLRATEVKPKLDRFIIDKCKSENINYKKWLIGNQDHDALNYKLSLGPNYYESMKISNFHKNAPMYFGNMGTENPPKHFKFKAENEGTILCLNNDLQEMIENILPEFFFLNNFGTRQSKGYGSFQVININGIEIIFQPTNYNFRFNIPTGNWEEALYHVSLFNKALRSGINEVSSINYSNPYNPNLGHMQQNTISRFYFKSLIFVYARHLNKQWDKKTIKEKYFNTYSYRNLSDNEKNKKSLKWKEGDNENMEELGLTQQIIKHSNPDILSFSEENNNRHFFLDFKDVFGLSSSEQWKSYGKSIIKKNATNDSSTYHFSDKSQNEIDFIERFKSPLFFKPLKISDQQFVIYVSYSELPNKYIGQKFTIYNNSKGINPKLCLQIPTNFKFSEFFEFIFNITNFNINNHIISSHKSEVDNNYQINYFNALKGIFDQLQK